MSVVVFALAFGTPGARRRSWDGLEDKALFAWACVWSGCGGVSAYCGFLVGGASPLSSEHNMPAIVPPEDHEAWLGGVLVIASRIARQSRPQTTIDRKSTRLNSSH